MIPLREQEVIRARFERELEGRVRIDYFTRKPLKVVLPGREACAFCEDVRRLLQEIAGLSERVTLSVREFDDERQAAGRLGVDKIPGIVIRGALNRPVRFFGVPATRQFPVFLETVIQASRTVSPVPPVVARTLKKVRREVDLTVFVAPLCPHSPAVAFIGAMIGLASPRVRTEIVELAEFPHLAEKHQVQALPTTIIDRRHVLVGALEPEALAEALVQASAEEPSALAPPTHRHAGPATPFQLPAPEERPAERRTAGGLILPGR